MSCQSGVITIVLIESALVTDTSSDDPLVLDHTFATAGNYSVEIAAWNCGMAVPFTATLQVTVKEPEALIFLPLLLKNN